MRNFPTTNVDFEVSVDESTAHRRETFMTSRFVEVSCMVSIVVSVVILSKGSHAPPAWRGVKPLCYSMQSVAHVSKRRPVCCMFSVRVNVLIFRCLLITIGLRSGEGYLRGLDFATYNKYYYQKLCKRGTCGRRGLVSEHVHSRLACCKL